MFSSRAPLLTHEAQDEQRTALCSEFLAFVECKLKQTLSDSQQLEMPLELKGVGLRLCSSTRLPVSQTIVSDLALYDMIGRGYAGMVREVPTMVEDET